MDWKWTSEGHNHAHCKCGNITFHTSIATDQNTAVITVHSPFSTSTISQKSHHKKSCGYCYIGNFLQAKCSSVSGVNGVICVLLSRNTKQQTFVAFFCTLCVSCVVTFSRSCMRWNRPRFAAIGRVSTPFRSEEDLEYITSTRQHAKGAKKERNSWITHNIVSRNNIILYGKW